MYPNKEALARRRAQLSAEKRARLEQRLRGDPLDAPGLSVIPRERDPNTALLSFAQERLWFLDQLEPGSSLYNEPIAVRLTGTLNIAALEHSLSEIVRRHESLRTTFITVGGQPIQRIGPATSLPLRVIDLRNRPMAEREAEATRLARAQMRQPFDLSHDQLIRMTLLCLGAEEYLLLVALHHIIYDGWSTGILLKELATLYTSFSTGAMISLPELPIQYADYALWQRQWLQGAVLEQQLAYWRSHLADLPILELPTNYPRPPLATHRGARVIGRLPGELLSALQQLSHQEDSTLFMTLLATFQALLARWSGQTDIAVGTPIAGRTHTILEQLIGFFANTLVLRTDLSGNPTFRILLGRVREVTLEAYAHQDLPFGLLVDALKPARDLSRNPLFQVMFVLQNAPFSTVEVPGLQLRQLEVETGTAKFDLTLTLIEVSDGLHVALEYATDLFDGTTIERFLGHWITLLTCVATNPELRLSELPLLSAAEQQQLAEWNATQAPYPQHTCLHRLFEIQVARTPDAIAVSCGEGRLTYAELNRRANQLARYLRSLGVGPDVLVGIYAERSLELVIGLYGILKAGGAYLPLDPSYPTERLSFMVADAGILVLLTHNVCCDGRLITDDTPRWKAITSNRAVTIVQLDADWEQIAHAPGEDGDSSVQAENLAYVIYTSGSTGRPKGVQIEQRAILNRLLWMQDAYQLTAEDRVLQKTPFSFDVSVWEFFWPLLFGAQLVLAHPTGHKDSAYLRTLIQTEQITTVHFVPPMLQVLLDQPDIAACRSLRRVICSGEALPYELQERCFAQLGSSELHNLYGPTEAAVDVTGWSCRRNDTRHIVPIGFPVANTQLYVLDQNLQLVPVGVVGELYIGGVQVARGYLNRPDLTAERFVPNPFETPTVGCAPVSRGTRLYRTGDRVRWLPDGAIEYLGRLDMQVKVRGFRIELGEIEAVLLEHPSVRTAVVLLRTDTPGHQRLVAYIVPTALSSFPNLDMLRTYLMARLPLSMIPSAFVVLEDLPQTPSGKIDRQALPPPGNERPRLREAYVAPQSEIEEQIAKLLQEILQVAQVGMNDNFFELGGHSLLLVQLQSRLQEVFGYAVPIVQLFRHSTVQSLARYLSQTVEDPPALTPPEERGRKYREALKRRGRPERC